MSQRHPIDKLDAALVAAFATPDQAVAEPLHVFVTVSGPLEPTQRAQLQAAGVISDAAGEVLTAQLSPQQVEQLASLPFVVRIALARQLKPLANDRSPAPTRASHRAGRGAVRRTRKPAVGKPR